MGTLSADQRKALDTLRAAVAQVVPEATEDIAWNMPSFKLHDKALICYAAFKDHYSLFPMSAQVVTDHADLLGERATGKGTIRLEYAERLPKRLVATIVKARVAEVEARRKR